ncbi:MAG: hypothetical protein NVSMB21_12290 [Vulcanimicrobiaceae bacterium]
MENDLRKILNATVTTAALIGALGLPSSVLADAVRADQGGHHAGKHRDAGPRKVQTINVDIDFKPHKRPEQGKLSGFDPVVTEVHVGDRLRFSNTDDIQHAIVGYSFGGGTIPEDYKIQGDPTKAHGNEINASEWSTGNIRPHSVGAPVFTAKTAGTFYFACAYHQKMMRGAIVVKQ